MNPKYPIRVVVLFMVLAIDQIATMLLSLDTSESFLFFLVVMSAVIFLTMVDDEEHYD